MPRIRSTAPLLSRAASRVARADDAHAALGFAASQADYDLVYGRAVTHDAAASAIYAYVERTTGGLPIR